MKLLKSAVVAIALAVSLGSFSTTAVACEDGRTCYGPQQAIDITQGKIAEAMRSIDDGDEKDTILGLIKAAQRSAKEVNANDKVAAHIQRAVGFLKKARGAVKRGKLVEATERLIDSEKKFESIKDMI